MGSHGKRIPYYFNKQHKISRHRLAWFYVYGEWPKLQIDHIDHNTKNNRIANLREVTNMGNSKNSSMKINNKSGFNGVCWYARYNKWQALVMVDGKNIYLGRFSDKEDAINARKAANIKYGFHENHGQAIK